MCGYLRTSMITSLNYKFCNNYIRGLKKLLHSIYRYRVKNLLILFIIIYGSNVTIHKFSASAQEVSLTSKINMCDTSTRLNKVYISDTKKCKKVEPDSIHHCEGKIYSTISSTLNIDAIRCYLIIESYRTVNYFFGVTTKEIFDPTKLAITASRCRLIASTLHDELLGDLVKISDSTFQTVNKLDIQYTWPVAHTGSVSNIVFQKVSIDYNYITNQLSSPLNDISHCNVESAFCKLPLETYIWNYDSKIKCPEKYLSKPQLETFFIYYNHNEEIVHIELPHQSLSLNRVDECGDRLKRCFEKIDIICSRSGIIFTFEDYSCVKRNINDHFFNMIRTLPTKSTTEDEVNQSQQSSNSNERRSTTSNVDIVHKNLMLGETFNFLERRISEAMMNISISLMYTRCELEHWQTKILSFFGDTHSSQILSSIVGMPVTARKFGDVFITYACTVHDVIIHTSLKYKGLFLTRPLVNLKNDINRTNFFQVYPDGNGYADIKYFSRVRSNIQEAVFKIGDLFVYFRNYTFVSIDKSIQQVTSLQLVDKPIIDVSYDFEESYSSNLYTASDPDVNNLFLKLQELSDMNAIMNHILPSDFSDINSKTDYDLNQITALSLSTLLTAITSPILIILTPVFYILSSIWSIYFTFVAIQCTLRKFKTYCTSQNSSEQLNFGQDNKNTQRLQYVRPVQLQSDLKSLRSRRDLVNNKSRRNNYSDRRRNAKSLEKNSDSYVVETSL